MCADSPRGRKARAAQASAAFFDSPLDEPPSPLEPPAEPEPESEDELAESDEPPSFDGCFDLRP